MSDPNEQQKLASGNDNNNLELKKQEQSEQPISTVVAVPYVPSYEFFDDWGVHRRDTRF
jgi:hypothetical protein